jgi:hypothetical protein
VGPKLALIFLDMGSSESRAPSAFLFSVDVSTFDPCAGHTPSFSIDHFQPPLCSISNLDRGTLQAKETTQIHSLHDTACHACR